MNSIRGISAAIIYKFAAKIGILILFSVGIVCPSYAKWVPSNIEPTSFFLSKYDEQTLLLEANISYKNGTMTSVDSGKLYLSCYQGRIDYFRMNFILSTQIVDYFLESPSVFIGVRNLTGEGTNTVASAPVRSTDGPPSSFAFNSFTLGFPEAVRTFDPIAVSETEQLYISAFPDAQFFEQLKRSGKITVISYQETDQRYWSAIDIYFQLDWRNFQQVFTIMFTRLR